MWESNENMTQQRQPLIRDMELVRALLIYIAQKSDDRSSHIQPSHPDYTDELIGYHMKIMHQHGLYEGYTVDDGRWRFHSLTWDGQEFMNAAKDDTVWDGARKRAGDAFSGLSLEVVKALLVDVTKRAVGLP